MSSRVNGAIYAAANRGQATARASIPAHHRAANDALRRLAGVPGYQPAAPEQSAQDAPRRGVPSNAGAGAGFGATMPPVRVDMNTLIRMAAGRHVEAWGVKRND